MFVHGVRMLVLWLRWRAFVLLRWRACVCFRAVAVVAYVFVASAGPGNSDLWPRRAQANYYIKCALNIFRWGDPGLWRY